MARLGVAPGFPNTACALLADGSLACDGLPVDSSYAAGAMASVPPVVQVAPLGAGSVLLWRNGALKFSNLNPDDYT